MAWTNSKIFTAYLHSIVTNISAMDLDTDASIKVALYGTTPTPSQTVSAANSAYAVDQWIVGSEISEAGQWAAGGVALSGVTVSAATVNPITFDAADTASGAAADLAAVFGCLVYDDTIAAPVADQGICYNYFGGSNSVVNGTFTVVWSASGIFALTL